MWQAARTPQGALKISLTNNGNAHIQIANFKLSLPGSQQPWVTKESAEYVLPGQSRDWILPANAEYPAPPQASPYSFLRRRMPVTLRLKSLIAP